MISYLLLMLAAAACEGQMPTGTLGVQQQQLKRSVFMNVLVPPITTRKAANVSTIYLASALPAACNNDAESPRSVQPSGANLCLCRVSQAQTD
jgi:hypothetical protein